MRGASMKLCSVLSSSSQFSLLLFFRCPTFFTSPSFQPSDLSDLSRHLLMASKIVIVLVIVFDLIAFGLAIAAEQRRNTAILVADENNYLHCLYNSDIATGFGIGALFFLLLSQVVVMEASKCYCCATGLPPGGANACALVFFLLTWVTFIMAELCLLAGSVFYLDPPNCQTVRKGEFANGAALIVFTAIFSVFYYISFSKASTSVSYGNPGNIGMSSGNSL